MVSFEEFKARYNELDQRDKDILAKSDIIMQTEEDVDNMMAFMKFMKTTRKAFEIISTPTVVVEEDVPPP